MTAPPKYVTSTHRHFTVPISDASSGRGRMLPTSPLAVAGSSTLSVGGGDAAIQTLNNQGGTLSAGQAGTVKVGRLDNQSKGRVLSSGALSVTADKVVRLLPPLIFTPAQADELIGILIPLIKQFLSEPKA